MDRIEMILYSVDIIGAVLALIAGSFLTLMCIVKKEKVGVWILGILTLILVMLLSFVLLVPLLPSPSYLFGVISIMIFIVGFMQLSKIMGISSRHKNQKK